MKRTVIAILSTILAGPGIVVAAPQAERRDGSILLQPHGDTLTVDVKQSGIEGVVSLTLPELVNDDSRRLTYTDTNLKRVEWQTGGRGALRSQWRQAGLGGYELEATPEAAGVALHWRVTNLSSEVWHEASGNICMRSKTVPQFFDPSGERIFLRRRDDGSPSARRGSLDLIRRGLAARTSRSEPPLQFAPKGGGAVALLHRR